MANSGAQILDKVRGLSTGMTFIDMVSGIDDYSCMFPYGSIVELMGPKSSSKSTLIFETIAYNQKINPNFKVLYIDFEHALNKQRSYLTKLGVNIDSDNFRLEEPPTSDEGFAFVLDYLKKNKVDLLVMDSLAAARPAVESEKGFGGNKMLGTRAKQVSEFLRNYTADSTPDYPAFVIINQLYQDIGATSFVTTYDSPSSEALKYYANIRIEIKELQKIKEKQINPVTLEEFEIPVSSVILVKTIKNKVGQPYLSSKYNLTYGMGIDPIASMVATAQRAGVIRNKGASKSSFLYTVNDNEVSCVGMSKLIKQLRENPSHLRAIGSQISPIWAEEAEKYILCNKAARYDESLSTEDIIEDNDEVGTSLQDILTSQKKEAPQTKPARKSTGIDLTGLNL